MHFSYQIRHISFIFFSVCREITFIFTTVHSQYTPRQRKLIHQIHRTPLCTYCCHSLFIWWLACRQACPFLFSFFPSFFLTVVSVFPFIWIYCISAEELYYQQDKQANKQEKQKDKQEIKKRNKNQTPMQTNLLSPHPLQRCIEQFEVRFYGTEVTNGLNVSCGQVN